MKFILAFLAAATITTAQPTLDLSQIVIGAVVELERDHQDIQRRIVGLPTSKVLSQDPFFLIRWQWVSQPNINAKWIFTGYGDEVQCWMRGEHPTTPVLFKSDLVAADILLDIPLSTYRDAPNLGDSLYFLHADPRTKLIDGVQMIQEDSREWGPVHAREFLRIVE